MGGPTYSRKKWSRPLHRWSKTRIQQDTNLVKKYGLKNMRELWRTRFMLRNIRAQTRQLFPKLRLHDKYGIEQAQKLIARLQKIGLVGENNTLDDILALNVESLLARRFQTIVYLKGIANTIQQARQLIVHRHIVINNRVVNIPGYIVKKAEEELIDYNQKSPYTNEEHPMKMKISLEDLEVRRKEFFETKEKQEKQRVVESE